MKNDNLIKSSDIVNSFNLFGKKYTIELISGGKYDDDHGNYARASHGMGKIQLNKVINKDLAMESTLHEIMHMISDELNLDLKEDQVNNLAVGIFSFLRENNINYKFPFKR